MATFNRRVILKSSVAAAAIALSPFKTRASQRIVMNDASRLSPTPVRAHWIVKPDQELQFVEKLRAELKVARVEGRPIAVGAARHSMGGQSLPRDGTAISFDINRVEPNRSAKTFQVHAGTRWHQVIRALDPIGFSPAVMQSNSDFGVASTFSVNAHGWPVPYGPFGATVRSIEMMLADGTVLSCSRTENAELFKLAMGGYGFFGIILKLEVDMVENLLLQPTFEVMPSAALSKRFIEAAKDPAVRMLYGRLNVSKRDFFTQSLLVSYRAVTPQPAKLPVFGDAPAMLSRRLYRAQLNSEVGKKARWFAETVAAPKALSGIATRNTLMAEPVRNLASDDRSRTDILHEYFVPPDRFGEFMKACQEVIVPSGQEMLNITLRYVAADQESVMAFAPTARIAGVMSFSQDVSPEGEIGMLRMTEKLIDRVATLGGSFYLPYRLHARRDQVAGIYKNTEQFVARKQHYDPDLVFRNAMWTAYFGTARH
ncbi:MAG: FAD-binding oxidoreductase [Hyphomicrobiaceae bacterium]